MRPGRCPIASSAFTRESHWVASRTGPLGNAIHGFLCADRPGLDAAARENLAAEILGRWGVLSSMPAIDLVVASDALRQWVLGKWPDAAWHREWPMLQRNTLGSIVRGSADLVLELPEGFVVIDHKSFPGTVEQAFDRAAGYAGQVRAYADAIKAATHRAVIDTFIHLPVSGIVVPLSPSV
jgi:ATP-dependent helicase/nuclease subunit A